MSLQARNRELQPHDIEWSTRSHASEISIDNNMSIEVRLGDRHIVNTDSCLASYQSGRVGKLPPGQSARLQRHGRHLSVE